MIELIKRLFHIHRYELVGYYEYYKGSTKPNNAIIMKECKCGDSKLHKGFWHEARKDSILTPMEG